MRQRRPKAAPESAVARHPRHFLREWREFRELTQEQLGERINKSGSNISFLENGKQNYTQAILEDIAAALDTTAASLLAEDPTNRDGLWELIEKLRRLPPKRRRQAIAILDVLASSETD